jgi:hypothetical protein
MSQVYKPISRHSYNFLRTLNPSTFYDSRIIPKELFDELVNSNYIIIDNNIFGTQFILNTLNGKGFNNTVYHYSS